MAAARVRSAVLCLEAAGRNRAVELWCEGYRHRAARAAARGSFSSAVIRVQHSYRQRPSSCRNIAM